VKFVAFVIVCGWGQSEGCQQLGRARVINNGSYANQINGTSTNFI